MIRYEDLQQIALGLAEHRAPGPVLDRIVGGLAAAPDVALARIWMVGPGDECATCPMRAECPDQTRCLHLAASAGTQAAPGRQSDGRFRRFPLGVRKVGRVGRGESVLLDTAAGDDWIVHRGWAEAEGIRAFAGQPLIFHGETLGVLAVFSRASIGVEEFGWLRTFADHAAVAVANARAFDEVARLRDALEQERDYLRQEVEEAHSFGSIVGDGRALRAVLAQIEPVAATTATVLVLGESGVGKELIARAIHESSPRRDKPLVRVNCASIPRDLFESEFFGHVKGAFTGALRDRAGRFQLADGGTLFLDEVGEIPLELQGKLLRVLQEGTFERVGDDATRRVDVRVVAATNRDLKAEAAAGRFRADLYYRLGVFPIVVPPLRERREDIVPLARHFIERTCARMGMRALPLLQRQAEVLERYHWPGNIRELQNVIERAVILSRGEKLQLDLGAAEPVPPEAPASWVDDAEWRRREKANLRAALEAAGGKVYGREGAAALLGIKPTTLASRLRALGIAA